MEHSLRVREVFHIAGRTILAADGTDIGELRFGHRFRAEDGTEIAIRAVSFSSPEAWDNGRRGVEVEVLTGEVSAGQEFVRVTSPPRDGGA